MKSHIANSNLVKGLRVIQPMRHEDERGYFSETYNSAAMKKLGLSLPFVQDNHVYSRKVGTLRGLHFQKPPYAQAKLIQCVAGRILDVCVDIRRGSETYGHHSAIELSAALGNQLYIPEGFAHGYCTLEPNCEVQYKVSNHYAPEEEDGIMPLDPTLGINWCLTDFSCSQKDRELPTFEHLNSPFMIDE